MFCLKGNYRQNVGNYRDDFSAVSFSKLSLRLPLYSKNGFTIDFLRNPLFEYKEMLARERMRKSHKQFEKGFDRQIRHYEESQAKHLVNSS